jgi:hypothetical protein
MSNGLSLREDIAATLQARMSWPQADACATDVVRRFERHMQQYPLTCEFCKHAPATHLLVADLRGGQRRWLVCAEHAAGNAETARTIARSPASAWLFALVPAGDPGT